MTDGGGLVVSVRARRLNLLVHALRRRDGSRPDTELAAAVRGRHDVAVSAAQLARLRAGHLDAAVTGDQLALLAECFGLDSRYFDDDPVGARLEGELDLLAAMRDTGVCSIGCVRLGRPDPAQLAALIRDTAANLPPDDPRTASHVFCPQSCGALFRSTATARQQSVESRTPGRAAALRVRT